MYVCTNMAVTWKLYLIHIHVHTYNIYLLQYFYGALLAIYVPEEHNKNDKSIVQTFELKVPEIFSTSNFFIS